MNKWLPILLFLYMSTVSAGMYKWEDEDGDVHYTDQAPDSKAEELELPPINSYTAPTQVVKLKPDSELDGKGPAEAVVPYEKLTITSPKMNETIRSNEGTVSVAFSLTPGELHEGDSYRLMLDGRAQSGASTLTNVTRGSHTVKVQIVDASGVFKLGSSAVIFHLHTRETLTKDLGNQVAKPAPGTMGTQVGRTPQVKPSDPTVTPINDQNYDSGFDKDHSGNFDKSYPGSTPGDFNAPAGASPSSSPFTAPAGTYASPK